MHYRIDNALNLVLCKREEDFTFEQLLTHLRTLLSDNNFRPGMNGLYDFSLVEHVNGDLQALLTTAQTIEDPNLLLSPARVAIVVSHEDHNLYKIFQGYCIMASDSVVEYKLFTLSSYQEALEFIGLNARPDF